MVGQTEVNLPCGDETETERDTEKETDIHMYRKRRTINFLYQVSCSKGLILKEGKLIIVLLPYFCYGEGISGEKSR